MTLFRYLYKFSVLILAAQSTTLLVAQDPTAPPPEDALHVDAIVGVPLDFPIDAPSDVSGIAITGLPDGLSYEAASAKIVGTATLAGEYTGEISFTQAGELNTKPVFFNIHPEGTPPDSIGGPGEEPIWIFGKVGEPLEFHLPYDGQLVGVDFGPKPDGTPSVLPAGLELDVLMGVVSGIPQEPGTTDFVLIITEGESSWHMGIVFDIEPAGGDGGPGSGPIHIIGKVGEELNFPLPYDPQNAGVDFGQNADGTPSMLPAGLQLDATSGSVVGVPEEPARTDFTLIIVEGGETRHMPIVFEIQPAGGDGGPGSEPIHIFGKVGDELNFPLPYDGQLVGVDFGPKPDGTPSVLPAGLELDVLMGVVSGIPQEPGTTDFVLIITEGESSWHMGIVFDIEPAGGDGGPGSGPIRIVGKVGDELNFPLPYDPSTTGVDFEANADGTPSAPPAGLELDLLTGSFVGVPLEPGVTDLTLVLLEAGETRHMPIVFDIQPAGGDGGPGSGPIRIIGKVGDELNFPLPYDPSTTGVDFEANADGTPSAPPAGLELDLLTGSFVGVPLEPGVTDLTLVLLEAGETRHMPIVFDIQPAGGDGGPGSGLIHIIGKVGEELNFPLPYDGQLVGVDFGPKPDGTPSVLPAGLELDVLMGVVSGIPQEPGTTDFVLIITEGESSWHMGIVFDIEPAGGDGGPGSGPIRIFGKVGEELNFPLPYDPSTTGVDFDVNADGTPSLPPAGLEFDLLSGSFVGVPLEPGVTDLKLVLSEGGETRHLPIVFDIHPAGDSTGGPLPINILGNAGHPLDFPLPIPPEVTDLLFEFLPEGLDFNASTRTVVGSPIHPGFFESGITGIKDGVSIRIPVFFDIFGDPFPGGGGVADQIKVHGFVGEFLSFTLPFPIELTQMELTLFADGTLAPLPVGIELDVANGQFIGFPQEPGFFESSLTITESEKSWEVPVFFDIQHPFDPNDSPPLPPYGEEFEDEDIILFGEVGTRFSFQFPSDEDETIELPAVFDEIEYALPDGLIHDASLNAIVGSPTASGVFEVLVLISKPDFQKAKKLRFLISDAGDAPRLSFYSESEFRVGQEFSFPILASGAPTFFDVIEGLPEGVAIDNQTGIVSGTLDKEDYFDLVVKVSNDSGDAYGIHFLDVDFPRPDDAPPPPDGGEHVEETEPFPGRVGVPFRLKAPEEFANATMTLLEGESFPAGIGFDAIENALISGTPTEAGLFKTRISIDNEGQVEEVILTFFIFDSVAAPQFVSGDYIRIRPGDVFELPLILANGPADITIETDRPGISLDTTSNTLRGTIAEPGFYSVVALAVNENGSSIHLIDIDVFDDGTYEDPKDSPNEPFHVWGILGQPLDFPLPADPFKSEIVFVDLEDGVPSTLPQGLEYIAEHALIKGTPELEGITELFIEITEFGFTRREHIIFEIHHPDNLPDDGFPHDPGPDQPDDGHVEPILGKVGERLYFEAPIEGENILFELVAGPDGSNSELPPGITFDAEAGILSGVPTRSGIYPIWVKVDDNGSVRTHFAPLLISGPEGAPVITSPEFISLVPGEHFEYQVTADNDPSKTLVEFFDVPGILSYDTDSMVLSGKFEFGGFFTLLIVAENDVGTGYGTLNVDVLGFSSDPGSGGDLPPPEIPLNINGTAGKPLDFELPSYIRGSSFVVSSDPSGVETTLPSGLAIDDKTGRISGTPEFPGFHFVFVTVDGGELPSLALRIGIVESTPAPTIVSSEWTFGHEEAPFFYQIFGTYNPFAFFATDLPAGLSLNSDKGIISGTTTEAGEYEITLSAENEAGVGPERILRLRIEGKPRFPVVSAPYFREGLVGELFELQVNSTESPHTFQADGLPAGLSIDSNTGLVSGTPEQDGFFEVRLEAHNDWGVGVFHSSILIKRATLAPVYFGPRDLAGKIGRPFFFNPPVEGGATEFAISESSPNALPEGLSIDPTSGVISGTPEEAISGRIDIVIRGAGGSIIVPINLKIVPALDAPVITSPSLAKGTAGQAFEYRIVATNGPIEFRAENLPAEFDLNAETGVISGVPASAGYVDMVIQARNVSGWGPPRLLILDIIPSFETPIVVSAPYAKAKVGELFEYQILASNSPIAFLVVGELPAGISFDSATGVLSGTPTVAGISELIVAASNGSGVGKGVHLKIFVQPSIDMPKITSSGTAFGKVGEPFAFRIIATGDPTSYRVENLPDGLSLNADTGYISGTPNLATDEPIVLVLYAINAAGSSLPRAVILEISPADEAPEIITGGHAIGKVGVEFRFQVFATNEPTTYFSRNLPEGLSIANDTGLITGTPLEAGEFKVNLQASNEAGAGEPAWLALYILPAAETPQVTSAPYALGKVSEEFTYQIEASTDLIDSYQVRGELPRGVDFDPTSGLISGSPVEPGLSIVYLTVTNTAGTSLPQSLTIKIQPSLESPVIVSSLNARGRVGVEFAYEIQATNMPEARPLPQGSEFDAIGLPDGLGVNQSSGIIAGAPEEAGVFRVGLVATNEVGQGNPKILLIEILPAADAPEIISASRVSAQVGVSFNYQILATNSPSSFDVDHSISWLRVDTASGFLSGSPVKPGIFYAEMVAENESGKSEYKLLEIVVYPANNTPKIISVREAMGQLGSEFSYQIVGTEDPTGFKVSGLPSGLVLDAESGEISGTPKSSGTFEIVLAASNANGTGKKAILLLEVKPRTELNFTVTDNNNG